MTSHKDEPYSNKFQRQAVEYLHTRVKHTAVVACGNSTIEAYLTRGLLTDIAHELGPYEIEHVVPLPDCSEFECKATFTADWGKVDLEEDPVTAEWMPESESPWEDS